MELQTHLDYCCLMDQCAMSIQPGGTLVSSGMQQICSFLAYEKSESANVAIISDKCIAECLIIKSVLEKFNNSTLVLSLNPKVLHCYPDVQGS